MKKLNWQFVMFVTVIVMLTGLCVSLLGIDRDQHGLVLTGLGITSVVCVSWWFWVMFVIRTMLSATDRTTNKLNEIKTKIGELRELLQGLTSSKKDK